MSPALFDSTPWLRRLLAVDRIDRLATAFRAESAHQLDSVRPFYIFLAVTIGCIPMLVSFPDVHEDLGQNASILSGLALCLAIIVRNVAKLPFQSVASWKKSLSLTHTAFGLGCIPAVLVLCLFPDSAPRLQDMGASEAPAEAPIVISTTAFILQVSLWAAVTEEFVYRGLVLSFIRRIPTRHTQRTKDILAIVVSAAMFGIAHLPLWGLALGIGATGLGIGFGLAYVATGERLIPLIVYHAIFDILSLTATIFLLR